MVTVEALDALHGVGDKVMGVDYKVHGVQSTLQAIEARIKVFEDMLQGVEDRGKDTGDKTIDGAGIILNLVTSMLICLDVEKQERQMTTDFFAAAAEDLKAVHFVDDTGQAEAPGSVWKRTRSVDKTQGAMKGTVAGVIHGVQIILTNHPHYAKRFIPLGVENINRPMKNNLGYLSRS